VVPELTAVVPVDLLADEPDAGPASLGAIARAALAGDTAALTPDRLDEIFVTGYRSFVTLASARSATATVLQQVADPQSGPVMVHCTAGKDRTGWVVAVLLTAVGVPWDDVMADYLRSGPEVLALFAPYRERIAEQGGDVKAMERAIAVFPHYLEAARDQMLADFGSWDTYLADGLGLPSATRDSLHAQLLA
jgi:protein-tyrosine phosphatase